MQTEDINDGEVLENDSSQGRLEAIRAKIEQRKQNLMVSKLPKRVLGSDKKLRSQIERTEMKMKATAKFNNYLDTLTMDAPA